MDINIHDIVKVTFRRVTLSKGSKVLQFTFRKEDGSEIGLMAFSKDEVKVEEVE